MVKRLNTATLDELQNVICCSNYRRDYMSEINMYKWEDIRKYFPPERVAEIRAKILELRKSGKYTDREPVSYTHLRAHETGRNLVCRLLLEKKKKICEKPTKNKT